MKLTTKDEIHLNFLIFIVQQFFVQIQMIFQQTDEDVPTFDEQILTAANSIANAVHTLVKAASAAQKELVEQVFKRQKSVKKRHIASSGKDRSQSSVGN